MKRVLMLTLILSAIVASCENEPYEGNIEKIDTQSQLYKSLQQIAYSTPEVTAEPVCLTFIYPFNAYLYNEAEEITGNQIIDNNVEFIQFLDHMENESAIGLSYPIAGTAEDGNSISIQNNEELQNVIEACIEQQLVGYCKEILENDCVWNLTEEEEQNLYNEAKLKFYKDGNAVFYYKEGAYRTSWVPLFIENQLYLNIHLEDDNDISEALNFNWKASIISDTSIKIWNETNTYTINELCDIINQCDYVEFKECETTINSGVAEFIFDNYEDCIKSLSEITTISNFELNFYETIQDANEDTNRLEKSVSYLNQSNPQIIFVRTRNTIDNTFNINRIVLEAETCEP